MIETPKDYEDLELIEVKLARKDYEVLRKILEREAAYGWLKARMKSHWIWVVSAGVLTLWMLYDRIIEMVK